MTWLEAHTLLDNEVERAYAAMAGKLKNLPETTDASTAAGVQRISELEGAVHAACETFARTRKWPRLDREAAWDLLRRLEECREFARFVAQPERPQHQVGTHKTIPDEKLLRWILCDYWAFAGIWRMLRGLEGGSPPKPN